MGCLFFTADYGDGLFFSISILFVVCMHVSVFLCGFQIVIYYLFKVRFSMITIYYYYNFGCFDKYW